jgi:hypothetical protein
MLGSKPSADSVASTDRNGDASASPFHLRVEHLSGEASKRQILGVRGQSPCVTACFRSESQRPLIMRALKAMPVRTDCREAGLPSFSPKGELLAWLCTDTFSSHSLRLLHLGNGSVTELLHGNGGIGGIGWSRDGDKLTA